MTDSEKLNVIISRLDSLEGEMQGMKGEMQGMKSDIQDVKKEMHSMKGEIQSVKNDLNAFKRQTTKSMDELRIMDKLILDEVERVHAILDMHKADKTAHSA